MTEDSQPFAPTPRDAVLAWWQAIKDKDTATLAAVLHEEHISAGGPGNRTVGRAAALADVEAFLAHGSVDSWEVCDVEERDLGGTAVCSYRWQESAHHDRAPFRLSGLATDVLVRSPRGWVIAAHHTSTTAPPNPR
jgi:ketosteroid isomerase-like protein